MLRRASHKSQARVMRQRAVAMTQTVMAAFTQPCLAPPAPLGHRETAIFSRTISLMISPGVLWVSIALIIK